MREGLTRIIVDWSGSWQAARPGNWLGRSPATKAAFGPLSDPMGRNEVKPRAGLESSDADTEPPVIWGRLHVWEVIDTRPTRSAGVVGTTRRKGGSQLQGETRRGEGSGLSIASGDGHDGSRTGR